MQELYYRINGLNRNYRFMQWFGIFHIGLNHRKHKKNMEDELCELYVLFGFLK
jgi:hypothetical protein